MSVEVVRCTDPHLRKVYKELINEHHSYINFSDRPSRKMYWLLYEDRALVGAFGLGSCFHRPKDVQYFMRKHGLQFNEIANNIVFCLTGNHSKNAGSKLLKACRKDAVKWWKDRYGDDLKAFQCFVLPPRVGAVYKADNWVKIGKTTAGYTQSVKTLYGDDIDKHPEAECCVIKGETKYLLRTFTKTEPKLIFMRRS